MFASRLLSTVAALSFMSLPAAAQAVYALSPKAAGDVAVMSFSAPKLSADLRAVTEQNLELRALKIDGTLLLRDALAPAAVAERVQQLDAALSAFNVSPAAVTDLTAEKTAPIKALTVRVKAGASVSALQERLGQSYTVTPSATGEFAFVEQKDAAGINRAMVTAVAAAPEAAFIKPDYPVFLFAASAPNDPKYNNLWGMKKINAPQAWSQVNKSDVIVAVIDTGMSINHEDLKANLWVNTKEIPNNNKDDDNNKCVDDVYGCDFAIAPNAPLGTGKLTDTQGHGTHVAGTIGATGNNGKGVAGVNWSARIMTSTIFANGSSAPAKQIEKAIDYAVANGARVLNLSWGGPFENSVITQALERASQKGVLIVVAAGNDASNNDTTPTFPASSRHIPNLITVMATDAADKRAWFSNHGKATVDLAAPGVSIESTYATSNTSYNALDGTSMATPHVAGAAALIWSHPNYKTKTAEEIRALIMKSARNVPALANLSLTGSVLDLKFLEQPAGPAAVAAVGPSAVETVEGVLNAEAVAIGAETTGFTVTTDAGSIVQIKADTPELQDALRALNGGRIRFDAEVTLTKGVETGLQKIAKPLK